MSRIAPLWAVHTSLLASAASCIIFFLLSRRAPLSDPASRRLFVYVLLFGSLVRVLLMFGTPGNYDAVCWQKAVEIFSHGGNIYAETERYNYTPFWFWLLGATSPWISPRAFLVLVDIVSAVLLFRWPGRTGWERVRMAALFFLNPVSFLLTAVHGQFDNLSVLFLLWGLSMARPAVVWALTTTAFLFKQIVFYEVIVVVLRLFRAWWQRLSLLAVSVLIFLLSFVPYWTGGSEGILKNVFLYRSYAMPYGLSALGGQGWLPVMFVCALCAYPFFIQKHGLHRQMLLGVLFFLTFTTGLGVQYFVLPIALGTWRPMKGFFVYTSVTTLYLLGSYFNMGITALSWVPLWAVWVAAAIWWWEASVHPETAKTS